MKTVRLKQIFSLSLVFAMLLAGASCSRKGDEPLGEPSSQTTAAEATTAATTTAATTAATTVPKRDPVTLSLIESGRCEFSVLCNFNSRTTKAEAEELVKRLKNECRLELTLKDINTEANLAGKTLIVGGGTEAADKVVESLKGYNDFAVSVEKDSLILAATTDVAYNYLFDYIINELFSKTKNGKLVLTDEDSILYSSSQLYGKTYPEYWREINGKCEPTAMLELFEDHNTVGTPNLPMKYRLYVPFDYDPAKEYPFVLFLHGAGHRGYDNAETVKGIVYNLFNHSDPKVDDMIVLVPQCPNGYQWVDYPWSNGNYSTNAVAESAAMKTLLELIGKIDGEFSIDDSRRYVFGLSMGGYGTWDIITRHPEMFTAAVALCGGGDTAKAAVKLKDMPIWAFHAADDTTVSVENTRALVKAITDAGGTKVKYTEYAASLGYGHGIGTLTARDETVFSWLFSQTK